MKTGKLGLNSLTIENMGVLLISKLIPGAMNNLPLNKVNEHCMKTGDIVAFDKNCD